MAGIQDYLNQIKNAIYGKDVRQAIHDGIHQCYEDGKAGAIDLVAREEIAQIVAPSGEAPSAAEVTDARIGADGITYTSLGLANRTQFTDLKNNLNVVESSLGGDIITAEVTVGGSINSSTGGDATSTTYSRIEYIDVSDISALAISLKNLGIYWYTYDSNKTHITHGGWEYSDFTIDTESASYVRMVVRHPVGQTQVSPTAEEIESGIVIKNQINTEIAEDVNEIINSLGGNVFKYSVTVGGSIDASTYSDTTSEQYSRIDYVDVTKYSAVSVSVGGLGAYWYTYDSNRNHITHDGWKYSDFTINTSDASYIRLVIRHPLGQTQVSPTEAEILLNVKIYADIIDVNAKIAELEEANNPIANPYMKQNFIPAKSSRYIYAKGKMWQYHWNTAEAFEAAAQSEDCWGISADVRVTSDGYLVCFHDATVDNQTDGTGAIEDMTWEQVQALSVDKGVWNGTAWTGMEGGITAKIPLLDTFLNICRKYGKVALIEPKAKGSAAIGDIGNANIDKIAEMLSNKGMINSCGFIAPTTTHTYLYDNYPQIYRIRLFDSNISITSINTYAYDPNTVYGAYNSALTTSIINHVHGKDRFILGYTPRTNPQSDDVEMVGKGLDAIFLFREPPAI